MSVDPISLEQQGRGAGATAQDTTPREVHRANQPSQRRIRDNKQDDRMSRQPVGVRIRRFAQATRGGRSGGSWLLPKRLGEPVGTAVLDGGRLAQVSLPMSPTAA